jgi:hypothetical protein
MSKLEDLKRGAQVRGIAPHETVTVVDVQWHGTDVVELFFKHADGGPDNQLVYRRDESVLEVVQAGRIWSFDANANLLRLVSEAYRIHLAHLFDPVLAVHTSLIEPLPHQITAVYGELLTRQPLRYLLADDPGSGKTIMAGLLIKELHFVEIDGVGRVKNAGSAPYLDYRPATADEIAQVQTQLEAEWLRGESLEATARTYAIAELIPQHLERVRQRREERIDKTMAAVRERLTKEINYWDYRANDLRMQERAGKPNAKINSARAQQRADELAARLERRMDELEQERQVSASPPVIIGGALVIPAGLLWGDDVPETIRDRRITEQIAMQAVMETEIALGHPPRDVSADNLGYDIESCDGETGQLRFIEVKGRRAGAETVTITFNEISALCNRPDTGILAIVEVDDDGEPYPPRYVRRAFESEPHFSVASVNYNMGDLLELSEDPG